MLSDPETAYVAARAGGRHAGMVERFDEMPTDQIRKSLASFQENVAEHEQKLANPERYVSDWPRKDPREQQGILSF